MEVKINEDKTQKINAKTEPFNFLGFTIRYDKDIHDRNAHYWNIVPSRKSINKLKERIRELLHSSLHFSPDKLVQKLNKLLRGCLNYFDIKGVSYAACAKREIRYYLNTALYQYYNRKSSLYGHKAFEILVN